MALINVENASKLYYSRKEVVLVLDNVSLTVDKAGKSTLLYIIGGLEKPTKGNVLMVCP